MKIAPTERVALASAVAAVWFLALTTANLAAEGQLRDSLFYGLPVALVAWHDVRLGFVFAAVGTLSAWAGGAIPQPGLAEPVWVEEFWAFLRLAALVLATHIAERHFRGQRAQ